MKKTLSLLASVMLLSSSLLAQSTKLPKPDMNRKTATVMKAYEQRRSVRDYADKALSQQDLSDLLWAALGQNRPDGHLTAPTAMNKQEVVLYVFDSKGVALYDPHAHTLTVVAQGDHRDIVAGRQEAFKTAPVLLVLVADMDKFGSNNQHAQQMASVDVGIVSQNINLFCAAAGLCTVPRGTMDQNAIRQLLGLGENQIPLINNPVGYPKK